MLSPGSILKQRYRVSSVIGQGGMSTVYLVEDLTLENSWAMKETLDIFPDRDKSEIISQFQKEAKILAGLSHPSLPRVIDYFTENDRHYLVEEFIKGKPSDEVLAESGRFDEMRIIQWALQVCELLSFLHNNGIIYRDLKPSNIMIDPSERVYLVDFGIARFFQGTRSKDTVIIGTPGYASPEHYGRGETDARSDIYSFGATLHHMLTGRDPADTPFHFEIPYVINPLISAATSSIIMKCLDMDPSRRFQSAAEVKQALIDRAIPALRKGTRPLEPPPALEGPEKYKNSTDLLSRTTKYLSYTSIFPASMSISGLLALIGSLFSPMVGIFTGIVSFPILCMEFWKRVEKVYSNQETLIITRPEGITFLSHNLNLAARWREITEVRVIKNRSSLALRRIKEIHVRTHGGEFVFDASFEEYRKLLDTIITQASLMPEEDGFSRTVYRKP